MTTKLKLNATPATVTEKPFHYFGSTCFHWATGATRQEVLEKLARMAGTETIKKSIKSQGGFYAWTCRVNVPHSADYQISYFKPQGVECVLPQEFNLMNAKGHSLPVEPKEPQV